MRILLSIYMIVFIGCLLCFMPALLQMGVTSTEQTNMEESELAKSLHFFSLKICMVGCIGATIPIFIDFSLDLLLHSTRHLHLDLAKFSMWLLLLSSFGANTFITVYIIPTSSIQFWASTITCKQLLIYFSGFLMLHAYGPKIWKWKYIFMKLLMFLLLLSMRFLKSLLNPNAHYTIDIFDQIISSTIFSLFMYVSILWMNYILTNYRKSIPFTMDEIYCTLSFFVFVGAVILQFVLTRIQGDVTQLDSKIFVYTQNFYTFTGYTVMVVVLNGRYIRTKIALLHIEKEAETKRMLTGFFSHEIRTPLNSMLMGLQILQRDLLPLLPVSFAKDKDKDNSFDDNDDNVGLKSIRLLVEELSCSCESAVDVLNDLLLYQSLEQNELILIKKSIPFNSLLRSKIRKITAQDRIKDVQLVINLPRGEVNGHNVNEGCIEADIDRFGHVIRTLVANAIESTPNGGIVTVNVNVTMRAHVKADNNSSSGYVLQIDVKDGGPVLSKGDRQKMFDSALTFTAGTLNTREDKGLGLWIANKIVLLHQGTLSVQSNNSNDNDDNGNGNGNGNTFTVKLPVRFPNKISEEVPPTPSSQVHTPRLLQLSRKFGLSSFRSYATVYSNSNGNDNESKTTRRASPPLPLSASPLLLFFSKRGNGRSNAITSRDDNNIQCNDFEIRRCATDGMRLDIGRRRRSSSSNIETVQEPYKIGSTVLIVDDDPINRKMLSRLLMGHCDSTVLAEDGAVAVEKMRQAMDDESPFDLVLMDYQMPNMDGPTAAQQMREMGYKGIIIGVTGNTLPSHIETYMSHGATEVMHKPLRFERLVHVVASNMIRDVHDAE